jgi:hypothetical protein
MFLSRPTRTRKKWKFAVRFVFFIVIMPPVLAVWGALAFGLLGDPLLWEQTPTQALFMLIAGVGFLYGVSLLMFFLVEVGILRIPDLEIDPNDEP